MELRGGMIAWTLFPFVLWFPKRRSEISQSERAPEAQVCS